MAFLGYMSLVICDCRFIHTMLILGDFRKSEIILNYAIYVSDQTQCGMH